MGKYATHTTWLPSSGVSLLIPGVEASGISTATINKSLDRAESIVEGYLAKRYTIPLTQNALITTIVEDITSWDLFRWLTTLNRGVQNSDAITARYKDAYSLLNDVVKGNIELYDSTSTRIPERSLTDKYYINTLGYTPTFNLDSDLSWDTSPGRLDGIADDRDADD